MLVYKGIKLAIIEAKSDDLGVGEDVAQAKQYAAKLQLGIYKIIESEKFFAIKQTGAAACNFFKLCHGVDGPHQNDVRDIQCIYTG